MAITWKDYLEKSKPADTDGLYRERHKLEFKRTGHW